MPRKVIIDCDPGVDDAMTLCAALFDPRLEVLAVTAVAGNCSAEISTRNVQTIVDELDPPLRPRVGVATEPDDGLPVRGRFRNGADLLNDLSTFASLLHNRHPSEKVICDVVRMHEPGAVTLLTLGPLTNLARAFSRDPELSSMIGHIVMVGGSTQAKGNVTPTAEYNIYCDPSAARQVFRSLSTKTLVPLDVTNRISLSLDMADQMPDTKTKVGEIIRHILPKAFRGYRQEYGCERIHIHDFVGYLALVRPDLFTTEQMAGDVETSGDLTQGMTVFDRRDMGWGKNMDVCLELDKETLLKEVLTTLNQAAEKWNEANNQDT